MNTMIRNLLPSFVLLTLLISITSAKDIYVTSKTTTTTNSENGCGLSMSEPCENINEALKCALPGDQILLGEGIFSGPLNVGLKISVASLKIKGIPGATIIDLQSSSHAFFVMETGVHFIDLVFRNGISSEDSLSGGITLRLERHTQTSPSSASLSLTNVFFKNIIGGALLVDSSSEKIFQLRLNKVVFDNITKKSALVLLGNVHSQISSCKFQNNGKAASSKSQMVGSAIFAAGNKLSGDKPSSPTITLSDSTFQQNEGATIINIDGVNQMTPSDLILVGSNSFNANVASKNIIKTDPKLSLIVCLNCKTTWSQNDVPRLCDVSCSLLGIHDICPQSCPSSSLPVKLALDDV